MFGFAFTTFAQEPIQAVQTILDEDDLQREGIIFVNATTIEISHDGGWSYFTENNKKFRLQWFDPTIPLLRDDGIHIQQQDIPDQYLDTWYFPYWLPIKIGKVVLYSETGINNATIKQYWETEFNWTRFSFGNGLLGFITTYDNNISRAVDVDGALNITIGEPDTSNEYDASNFVDWYWDSIFSWDVAGIPSVISVFTKIIVVLNFVSAVLVIREIFKL